MPTIDIITTAHQYYDLGFNVFPQPYNETRGFPYRHLIYTRIHRDSIPRVFAGRTNLAIITGAWQAPSLFAIECHTPEYFDEQVAKLRERKINIWAIRTQQGGQFWFLNPQKTPVASRKDTAYSVIGEASYVLCPPSGVNGEQLEWYIKEGKHPPRVNKEDLSWLYLYEAQPALSNYVKKLRLIRANRMLDPQPRTTPRIQRRSDHTKHVDATFAYFQKYGDWKGREGLTEMAIVYSLLQLMADQVYDNYSRDFQVSVRELSATAHLTPKTVMAALKRLQAKNLLQYRVSDNISRVRKYRFSNKLVRQGARLLRKQQNDEITPITILVEKSIHTIRTFNAYPDLLEKQAIGYRGLLVYATIKEYDQQTKKPRTTAEIATMMHLSLREVQRLKEKLMGFNLVTDQHGYLEPLELDPDHVHKRLETLGVLGRTEKRNLRYRAERQWWAAQQIIYHRERKDQENLYGLDGGKQYLPGIQ